MLSDLWQDLFGLAILLAVGLFVYMKVNKMTFKELVEQLKEVFK